MLLTMKTEESRIGIFQGTNRWGSPSQGCCLCALTAGFPEAGNRIVTSQSDPTGLCVQGQSTFECQMTETKHKGELLLSCSLCGLLESFWLGCAQNGGPLI